MPTSATLKSARRNAPAASAKCALRLSVQYATVATELPTRPQLRRWVSAALLRDAELTVRLVDEAEGRQLNRDFRGKDYATNVLTFVYGETPDGTLSGDIILCVPVVTREAAEQSKQVAAHYAHLTVHGVLHLQGYEHERDAEAEAMEALEKAVMDKLGYPDPYKSTEC